MSPLVHLVVMSLFALGQLEAASTDFAIDLHVKLAKQTKKIAGGEITIGSRPKSRAVIEGMAGKDLTVSWSVRNSSKLTMFKDVTVHFFAVKIGKAGQQEVPRLDKNVPAESALSMDFKPKDKSEGELTFAIEKPGTYLLRIETLGAAQGGKIQEYFAALDLVIK